MLLDETHVEIRDAECDHVVQLHLWTRNQAEPEAVEFGAAEKGFAFRFEVLFKVAHEVDGANFGEGKFVMLAVGREQVEGIDLAEARRIKVAG